MIEDPNRSVTRPGRRYVVRHSALPPSSHIYQHNMKLVAAAVLLSYGALASAAAFPKHAELLAGSRELTVKLSSDHLYECDTTTVTWSNGLQGQNVTTSVQGEFPCPPLQSSLSFGLRTNPATSSLTTSRLMQRLQRTFTSTDSTLATPGRTQIPRPSRPGISRPCILPASSLISTTLLCLSRDLLTGSTVEFDVYVSLSGLPSRCQQLTSLRLPT